MSFLFNKSLFYIYYLFQFINLFSFILPRVSAPAMMMTPREQTDAFSVIGLLL